MPKQTIFEGTLLDETLTYTLAELIQMGHITDTVIVEMVEFGVIEPQGKMQEQWVFTSRSVIRFNKAMRLHQDLAINWAGISLVLDLLEERDDLRQQLGVKNRTT
ncbi:MAG: chaperone modulator CbpM [Proteobacteria bacterium]|nr:chaperone modulator CbpM [Pseudomonadota bacterium]